MPTVTRVNFTVGSDQSTVSGMAFGYEFSGYGCSSGSSGMTSGDSTPITDGQFTMNPSGPWTGPVVGSLQGTFDTPTSAHGTGKMWGSMWCMGPTGYNMLMSGSTGTFSWTATTQ
jgi:hypothetical protein